MALAQVDFAKKEDTLIAYLAGEIDHDSAQRLRGIIDARLLAETIRTLVLDFEQVDFMDSSGLGLVLGRKRRMQAMGGALAVQHPPEQIEKILSLVQVEHVEV